VTNEKTNAGVYARRQLVDGGAVLRWSHGRRFLVAEELVREHRPARVLDYGCGDGTFLGRVCASGVECCGLESDPDLVRDCTARLGGEPALRFALVEEADSMPPGEFDMVFCMEVLEHCTDDSVERVLERLGRVLAPAGRLVISVPVEVGPTLIVKQAVRALAGWRGSAEYRQRERYSLAETWAMLSATTEPPLTRPVYEVRSASGVPHRYHGHKGFNWRALRLRVETRFTVQRTFFSPLPALGSLLNSQAWFLCAHR
jgi:SAM-dependent methyltransferase